MFASRKDRLLGWPGAESYRRPPGHPTHFWLLRPRLEHNPKPRLPAHHPLVRLGGAFEGIGFVHRTHAGLDAEGERVLRVDRGAGVPPFDRAASHEELDR